MYNSIFLNIYFNKNSYNKEYEKEFKNILKEIFLNKWLHVYIYNCSSNGKKLLDIIYQYANIFGTEISLIIDDDNSVLNLIQNNYMNIDSIILHKVQDFKMYNEKFKKMGINIKNSLQIQDKDLVSSLILEDKISYNK